MQESAARKQEYVEKARAELATLAAEGLRSSGNAFSSVLFLKGDLSEDEKGGQPLLSGEDGKALRASLVALGYAPEDWVCVAAAGNDGEPIDPALLRKAIMTLDPATVIACDDAATADLREAFSDELSDLESFEQAMMLPGELATIMGMRMMNLGGFAAALADKEQKQLMWSRLKRLPPLGAPY
ncbi:MULTISPECIES: hypothetical protein [Atopobiaceae]|uniref:Uncharacterized protein n=1 Tax=Parafannyhessea umbonata TaxID=604330 RepID=A0A1H9Q6L8_9ACTN|nr:MULTISPECIES: hypothetical protein [Atopobiaceae]SEH65192.1 hypothetical protein SAMN05216447_11018 [Parafannyhessea umbonata]SER56072.1 hypothetical protein SAMN05216446_1336 [Parafannyhessea umbonata]SJZ65352.1 hypothetical protein SAMN06298223_0989 [Olsenella sp. KH1P3]